jgi:hypothetical protein
VDLAAVAADLGLDLATTAGTSVWRRRRRTFLPLPDTLPDLHGFFARDPGPPARPADLLLVDTETTGLVGGTGTLPFLVGLAWWEGTELVVEQVLLPGPGHEPGLLAAVAAAAAGRRIVVTYNGASFDLPLLRTRALLNRRADPLVGLGGWDLVVPARRLWNRILDDCRQQTVETALTRRERAADEVPGAQIPGVWFAFLAGEGHADLAGVLRHNRRDMEGMAVILRAVCRAAESLDPSRVGGAGDWRAAWSLGRICEHRGDQRRAADWLRRAVAAADRPDEPRLVADALRLLKRDGDWPGAASVAASALAAGLDESWLHREAAMLHEHRLGDLDKALAHALRAGDDHRVRRLRRRGAGGGRGEDPACSR